MPRPPRIHLDGAVYYVTSRAVAQQRFFHDAEDFHTYLALLTEAQQRFGVNLFAYTLLPDQMHLCLELPNQANLSTFMHAINSCFTKHFIKRYDRRGPVFQSRFRSTLVEKATWLLQLTGYLHLLPQRSGITDELQSYPWSSYPSYTAATNGASKGPHLEVAIREVSAFLEAAHPGLTYAQYVASMDERQWRTLSDQLHQWVVGSPTFVAQAKRERDTASRKVVEVRQPLEFPLSQVMEMQPRPRRVWRPAIVSVGSSLFIAIIGTWVASVYIQHMRSLKQAVLALVHERRVTDVSSEPSASFATAQLANLQPVPRLAGTTWQLQIRPMDETAAATIQTDELRFAGGTMMSTTLNAQGFAGSNYSLSTEPNGPVRWETMQTGPHGEIVCWRGAWKERLMHGIMTRQIPGHPVENYEFMGSQLPAEGLRSET